MNDSWLGDMPSDELREHGRYVFDWITDYLAHSDRYPVLSPVAPGALKAALPSQAPATGESMETILADLDRLIVPGLTHWNHPAFFGYFATTGSAPGVLADSIAAALNVLAMMWRTSPAATELEEVTLDWLRQMIGLPAAFTGVIYDTASIASLCAIAAAREAATDGAARQHGLARGPRLRLYASEHAHSSIDKAAITLGLGLAGVRKIPADAEYRMEANALARAIEEDRREGWQPFCAVATVGTTSTSSIDPVPAIAEICEREKIWLHVDAAYGGSAAVVPEMRWVLDGCERADSFVMNPHKWLFVQMDCSVLFCRRLAALRDAFSLVPSYLQFNQMEQVTNFMDYGPQLGRRFRALKLWFVFRYFGVDGLAARLRQHLQLAQEFAQWVDASPDFERLAPTPFSLVCFRAKPRQLLSGAVVEVNEQLLDTVNRRGKVFLSHTKLDGKFALRLAIGNLRTTREHVRLAWSELSDALEQLKGDTRLA